MKKILSIAIVLSSIILVGCQKSPFIDNTTIQTGDNQLTITGSVETTGSSLQSFEECEKAGYPIMESYPRQCNDGKTTFVENIENNQATGDIKTPEITSYTGTITDANSGSVAADQTGTNYEALQQKLKAMMDRRNQEAVVSTAANNQVTEEDIQNLEDIIDQIIQK